VELDIAMADDLKVHNDANARAFATVGICFVPNIGRVNDGFACVRRD
jgi:hypothetical protein